MRTKGMVYPKAFPYFVLREENILKRHGHLRIGKIKGFYIVEDQYFAAKYHNFNDALELFNENVEITEEIEEKQ